MNRQRSVTQVSFRQHLVYGGDYPPCMGYKKIWRKKQGNSRPVSRVLYIAGQCVCHLSRLAVTDKLYRPTLRCAALGRAALRHRFTWTFNSRRARPDVSPRSRWSLTPPSHPYRHEDGGYFLLHLFALADDFSLGSGMPCVARTFLLRHAAHKRQTVRLFLCAAKVQVFHHSRQNYSIKTYLCGENEVSRFALRGKTSQMPALKYENTHTCSQTIIPGNRHVGFVVVLRPACRGAIYGNP